MRTFFYFTQLALTLSSSVASNGYTSKGHTGLTHLFNFFDIRALCARVPECQKKLVKEGGLEQYGAERFDRLIFATIRKENVVL